MKIENNRGRMRSLILYVLLLVFNTPLVIQQCKAQNKTQRKKIMNDERKELAKVASRSFSWLTGTAADNDYVSVGKIAHYFGVISLRINSNHSLSRGGLGKSTFQLLNTNQKNSLLGLLSDLKKPLNDYKTYHELVNRELEKLIRREPFDKGMCIDYSKKILLAEGQIGYISAKKFHELYQSLSPSQISSLKMMRTQVESKVPMEKVKSKGKGLLKNISHEDTIEIWNLSTRFMAWVTGTEKDDEFTPTGKTSQHFGFVSVRVGSGHGITRGGVAKEVMQVLNTEQIQKLKDFVKAQKPLMDDFLALRFRLTKTLRGILKNENVLNEEISKISEEMGTLEGEMTVMQAKLYIALRDSFSEEQIEKLFEMRTKYLPSKAVNINNDQDRVERGKKVFNLCTMCHTLESNKHLLGPSLHDILGKTSGKSINYNYSPAMKAKNIIWTKDNLEMFLENPKTVVPGTTMPFSGIENKQDREALILYLESLK